MKNLFNSVKLNRPPSSWMDLTHDVKLSGNLGELIPCCIMECIPGDFVKICPESMVRFQPLITPCYHRFDISIHYFFVPNRILWDGWEDFITGNGTPDFPVLRVVADDSNYNRLMDYLGVPKPSNCGATDDEFINAFPFAAFQTIYNEYYRDQNLVTTGIYDSEVGLIDGDNSGNVQLRNPRIRAWEHDYLTSALPFAQKGSAVDLPLGDVQLKDVTAGPPNPHFTQLADHTTGVAGTLQTQIIGGNTSIAGAADLTKALVYNPAGTLEVGATSITDLRRAFRLQEYLERLALSGTRYKEFIKAIFGEDVPDSRLQRPEYITGIKAPVVISEVLQTSSTDGTSPQGNLAGHGVGFTQGKYGQYKVNEHGYIMGIMSIMPKTAYQQGFEKTLVKK